MTVNQASNNAEKVLYNLYRHEHQHDGSIRGYELEAHLKETGLTNRALSLESELIMGWITDPSTYPEELKGMYPLLWGSAQGHDDDRLVPYLDWSDGEAIVRWHWLDNDFYQHNPALLASTQD